MKHSFIVLLAIIISVCQANSQSSKSEYPTLWIAFISVGYANATSSNVNDYYEGIVDSYHVRGVPIPTQTRFGRTVVVNTGVLFTRLESMWMGICIGYWYSPAYSSYKDYLGTLRVNGCIKSYEISIKLRATLFEILNFPINLAVQPGIAYASSFVTQETRYYNLPTDNYDWKLTASAWGPCLQSTLGATIPLGSFTISLEGGYRFGWNKVKEETIESSSGNQKTYEPWDIGQAGIVTLITLDLRL